jgi:glutaconate CoA-transferase subunit A
MVRRNLDSACSGMCDFRLYVRLTRIVKDSNLAQLVPLREAIAALVHDGSVLAMEGFTHLIPFAAGHEVIRQGRRNLTLIRMTPDLLYDQMIGMGCASRLVFSWGGNPGVGSLHRFRDAIQTGWPAPLAIEEHSHADMAARYQAGASGLPFAVLRGYLGSDIPKHNASIRSVTCPFTGEVLTATRALNPDVAIVHAQRADRKGNVLIQGITGIQKEAVLASKQSIVTVEEIVERLDAPINSCVIPGWVVTYVCEAPGGAFPSYAHGYYQRDNAFCKAWDGISRDREVFTAWMRKHVLGTADFTEFRRSLARSEVQRG